MWASLGLSQVKGVSDMPVRFTPAEWTVIDSMHEPYPYPDNSKDGAPERIYNIVTLINNEEFRLYCEFESRHSKAEAIMCDNDDDRNDWQADALWHEASVINRYSDRISEIRKEYQKQGRLNEEEWGIEIPGVSSV